MSIVIRNSQRRLFKFSIPSLRDDVRKLLRLSGYHHWDLGIILTGDKTLKTLNQQYRGINLPTDILSFPFYKATRPGHIPPPLSPEHYNLGDLYISVPYLIRWCQSQPALSNRDPHHRLRILIIHGIAHLLGYDHERDDQWELMAEFEEEVSNNFWKWKSAQSQLGVFYDDNYDDKFS